MAAGMCPLAVCNSSGRMKRRPQSKYNPMLCCDKGTLCRRLIIVGGAVASMLSPLSLNYGSMLLPVLAEENSNTTTENKDEGVLEALKSMFDPIEKTKSGKMLPKAYLKSAREVVKTLRESLEDDTKDISKFRRTADAAKESIREYLNGWRGQKTVVDEKSYVLLEKAIRSLANFYSRAGPSATLPENVKAEILADLNQAEEFL